MTAGALLLTPASFKDLGQSAATVTLFVSNILFWRKAGYFDPPAALKPLLHTWSLSVEEQFYISFPLLLVVIRRFFGARFALCLSVLAGISFAVNIFGTSHYPVAAFYLAPARARGNCFSVRSSLAIRPRCHFRPLPRKSGIPPQERVWRAFSPVFFF